MSKLVGLDRRELIVAGSAATMLCGLLAGLIEAKAQSTPNAASPAPGAPPAPQLKPWEIELNRILGAAKPVDGKVAFDLPEAAENGNTIPFMVAVESPMTEENHVRAIHVLTTENPQPLVASFRLSPDSGIASVSSRMRLIKSQDVIAIVELSQGPFHLVRRVVKVSIGCCGY